MSFSITGRPQVVPSVAAAPRMARKLRKPTHNFFGLVKGMTLHPIVWAPVVPGETLKNVLFQARCLSTPLNNQLTGWWAETYWFYVKHRHMSSFPQYAAMMLDLEDTPLPEGSAVSKFGIAAGTIDFTRQAYVAIVNEFFRDETEQVVGTITDPVALRLRNEGWWDSIMTLEQAATDSELGADTIGGAALDQVSELSRALETYQLLRAQGLTALDYDSWLRSFGVSIAAPREDRPEMLRYTREWTYPSNTVTVDSEGTQQVSSVASWSLTERIDKDRYFKEPGLVVGCMAFRPKLHTTTPAAAVNMLNNAVTWATPLAGGARYMALQGDTVIGATLAWDTRDLFIHGDSITEVSGMTNPPVVPMLTSGALTNYLPAANLNALFVAGASGGVLVDGVTNLNIASASFGADETPRTV